MTVSARRSRALIDALRRSRADLERRYPVRLIGVVGSYARGDAQPDSDVDILYAPKGPLSLFDLGALWSDLHDLTGLRIDLVDHDRIKPAYRSEMQKDLVPF